MNASEINFQTKDINQIQQNISISGINQNIQHNKTDVQIVDKSDSPEIKNNKGKTSLLKYLVISIIVLIVITVVVIIIVLATKKKDKKDIINRDDEKDIEQTTDLNDFGETIESDNSEPVIDYDEAANLIDSEKTKENHNLLEESSNELDELILICDNTSFNEINLTINDEFPSNLLFLENPNETSLLVAKDDLDLYISRYVSLIKEANTFINYVSQSLKISSTQLKELKIDINNITKLFEANIQYFAYPLKLNLSENNTLRNLLSGESKEKYEKEVKNLNNYYNDLFKNIKNITEKINLSIKKFQYLAEYLKLNINNNAIKFQIDLKNITIETLHPKLIKIKDSFIYLHKNCSNFQNELNKLYTEIKKYKDKIEKYASSSEEKNIIESINEIINKSNIITKDLLMSLITSNEPEKNMQYVLSSQTYSIYKSSSFIESLLNKAKSVFSSLSESTNVEISTSLDLLFIMDITGSMKPYLEEAKKNIITIINDIIKECPGININLGFIGYRDYYEEYINIEFTQNYAYLKSFIDEAYAHGGGNDFPEDVAFALELALNKTWKSNARMAVFIADAPAHGTKYGYYSKSGKWPKRRPIEESIAEMAEANIALFCLNIYNGTNTGTKKMFQIFKDIYDEKKQNNSLFQIVEKKEGSFSKIIVDYAIKAYNNQRLDYEKSCLIPKRIAVEILKSTYGINNKKPDDNVRFILGKCNPVLLIPGIYSTKLKVKFNCKGLATKERNILKEIRLYCGNDICKDEEEINEEHRLLFSTLDKAFGIDILNKKKHGACLGYISNYFMNENECPKNDKNKSICYFSKYIKVAYYGGTANTLENSRCGVEAISDIFQTGSLKVDSILSEKIAPVIDCFDTIAKNLTNKGYKEGFSLGALPNDYRRYLATNNFASKVFVSQINRLYNNTGKPVIIIAHSYGTLLTLTNLIKNENNTEFMKKIKKFVAMAPPFSGSSKLLDIFLHGTQDFNKAVINYPQFGQYLLYKSLPTAMELRPLSIASKIFLDFEYKELGDALRNRLEIESKCKAQDCNINEIREKTSNFDNIFKDYFPSLLDPECSYESDIGGNQTTLNRKCFTNIYNVGNCPSIIKKSEKPTEEKFLNDFYCNKYGEHFFYQGECEDTKRNCLDEIYYSDKCPYVYSDNDAVNFMLKRFEKFSEEFGVIKRDYFDSHETIRSGLKNSIEYLNKISLIKDLPIPPVDVDIVYASFHPTIASLVLDDNDFTKEGKILTKGGDDTVPTWSSLLTGLKWIYDKKKKNLNQKIKLIEYCSRLAKVGKYQYNKNKEQNFAALSCRCLDKDKNVYLTKKEDTDKCTHAQMLQDDNLFEYLYSVINDPKEVVNDIPESKINAAKFYKQEYNYEQECNRDIYNILNTAK